MERGFNLISILQMQEHENKHKIKPTQFISVAGGVTKRLESNLKSRRSTRLTVFDHFRNLPKCQTPVPPPFNKVEQRRLQLLKWKEEKEKKKKEVLAQKKKPFVAGLAKNSLKLELPPPVVKPSTSGRVTRSQVARNTNNTNVVNHVPKKNRIPKNQIKFTESFAPENATFNPLLKDLMKPVFPSHRATEIENDKLQNEKGKKSNIVMKQETALKQDLRNLRNRNNLTDNKNHLKFNSVSPKPSVANLQSSSSNSETSLITKVKNKKQKSQSKNGMSKNMISTKSGKNNCSSSMESDIVKKHSVPKTRTSRNFNQDSKGCLSPFNSVISSSSDETDAKSPIKNTNISIADTRKTSNSSLKDTVTFRSKNERKPKSLINISNSSSIQSDAEDKCPISKVKSPKVMPRNMKGVYNNSVQDLIFFTPMKSVPKSESSSEEKLRSPKCNESPLKTEQVEESELSISPRVYLSRGKDNARKEMIKRIDEGLLQEDYCDMTVEHFRRQLDSEIERMTEMCNTWDIISEQTTLPEAVQEAVLAAVGQARLLMSQKMQQFASLLGRCESPEPGQALVTCSDLQGFWDMVFMQVENVDMRFKKLEEMRARGWTVERPAERPARPAERPVRPAARVPRPASRPAASRLKDIIAAARRAKKERPDEHAPLAEETRTFEAGFFRVQSPVRAGGGAGAAGSGAATPLGKLSLLKAVLSSEAKKASDTKSSFAMLRASLISKNIDSEDATQSMEKSALLTPMNWNVTPGRSILKRVDDISTKTAGIKSIKVVLFDDAESKCINESSNSQTAEISGVEMLPSPDKYIQKNAEEKDTSRSTRKSVILREETEEDESTRDVQKNADEKKTRRSSRKSVILCEETVEDVSVPDVHKNANEKENRRSSRRSKLLCEEDEEISPVMTRSKRKSIQTSSNESVVTTKRSSRRKKPLQEAEVNDKEQVVEAPVKTSRSKRKT